MTFALDSGDPLLAARDGAGSSVSLVTQVCRRAGCSRLHLAAKDPTEPEREPLALDWDAATGRLEGVDDRAQGWLASEQGSWLASWAEHSQATIRTRFEQLRAQELAEPSDNRPAPPWKPGGRVSHRSLYPADFAPSLRLDGKQWLIVDACCPDPACPCSEVALELFPPNGESTKVVGELGERRPTKATTLGKALWTAIHEDASLLQLLVDRREDIRLWGPFVVSAAYEAIRLARHADGGGAPDEIEATDPHGLVRRMFDAGQRLHAATVAIDGIPPRSRIELRGAVARDAWLEIDLAPLGIALIDDEGGDVPWLTFFLGFRDEASVDFRMRRCALGLPLIGEEFVPIVESAGPDGTFGPPSPDEARIAIAAVDALLALVARQDEIESATPVVIEHHADLAGGRLDVRLTAHRKEAEPAEPSAATVLAPTAVVEDDVSREAIDVSLVYDEDEDDLEDDSPGSVLVAPLLEAFTDAALDRAVPKEVVATARRLLDAIAGFAFDQGLRPFEDRAWSEFLQSYGPREVVFDEADIDHTPAAVRAIAEFLGEVGHVDARRFRGSVERALPTFQRRARDPRHFSKLKELHGRARGAGIDLDDPEAVERFFELEALTSPPPLRATTAAGSGASTKREPSPARWSPAPGEPRPAPGDPCGCGSGKRYKKCCMPR